MKNSLAKYSAIALAATAALVFYFQSEPEKIAAPIASKSDGDNGSSLIAHPETPASQNMATPTGGTKGGARNGIGADVASLIQRGSTADLEKAFQLLQSCATVDELRRAAHSMPAGPDFDGTRLHLENEVDQRKIRCSDVDSITLQKRFELIAKAAATGSPTAAIAFYQAGPNGSFSDLADRRDDPLVVAWLDQAIGQLDRAARAGSIEAAALLGSIYGDRSQDKTDQIKALGYELAANEALTLAGKPIPPRRKSLVDGLRKRLDANDIRAAEDYAAQVVSTYHTKSN